MLLFLRSLQDSEGELLREHSCLHGVATHGWTRCDMLLITSRLSDDVAFWLSPEVLAVAQRIDEGTRGDLRRL